MVRTSGGIRISAGKSSKKGGGGGGSGGSSRPSPSTPSGKSSSKSNNRLPPIPHCEAPSWQKPITNFFNSDAGPSKSNVVEVNTSNGEAAGPSRERENTQVGLPGEKVKRTEDDIDSNDDDEKLPEKRRREETSDEETIDDGVKGNSKEVIQNDNVENSSEKQSTNRELPKKEDNITEKCVETDVSNINGKQIHEKQEEERGKENVDGNTSN